MLLEMCIGVLDASFHDEWQQAQANDVWGGHLENDQSPVHDLAAINLAWTDLTILHRVNALSVIRTEEVLLHSEICQEDLDGKALAWDAVTSMIDDERDVVDLQQHAEVEHRPHVPSRQDASFGKEESASD